MSSGPPIITKCILSLISFLINSIYFSVGHFLVPHFDPGATHKYSKESSLLLLYWLKSWDSSIYSFGDSSKLSILLMRLMSCKFLVTSWEPSNLCLIDLLYKKPKPEFEKPTLCGILARNRLMLARWDRWGDIARSNLLPLFY